MASKLIKIGGFYLAYEIISTAVFAAVVAWGLNFPGF